MAKTNQPSVNHPTHSCQAIVVSCMDFRLRTHLRKWTIDNIKGGFDRLALAGGVQNLPFVLEQIELSVRLHKTEETYLINHEDCGAYGASGSFKKHMEDLLFAKKVILQKFPDLKVFLFYLKLNGDFVDVEKI